MTVGGWVVLACGYHPRATFRPGGQDVSRVAHDHGDAGLQALKDDKLVRAEHEFTKAGDDVRLAETFVRQGRYDEADLLLAHAGGGRARLMAALVLKARGDDAGYLRALAEARDLGDAAAAGLLDEHDDCGG